LEQEKGFIITPFSAIFCQTEKLSKLSNIMSILKLVNIGCLPPVNSTLAHFPDTTFPPLQLETEKFHIAPQLSNYHFTEPHNEIIEVRKIFTGWIL